jgi:predicted GH43/DUF377 family glycosyl hydrolase
MRILLCCLLAATSLTAASVAITATRVSNEPLLKPTSGWMAAGVFNTAVIRSGGKTILLFRAQDGKGVSRIGYADSADGLHFHVRAEPVLSPEASYEKGGGVEDPRVLELGGTYYLTYTAYDGHSAQLAMATSKDLIHWERKGILLPAYKGTWNTQWTKSGAIVPQKVNGKWWMYYLGTRKDSDGKARDYMGLAESDDLLHWKDATSQPVLDRRPQAFDSRVMEPGPTPIMTDAGILLLYNGANEALVYGPGWVLFDKNDPRKVIARADAPFILPSLKWEVGGQVPNVIFIEGDIVTYQKNHLLALLAYYGAADKYIGALDIRIRLSQ